MFNIKSEKKPVTFVEIVFLKVFSTKQYIYEIEKRVRINKNKYMLLSLRVCILNFSLKLYFKNNLVNIDIRIVGTHMY